jgi:hypothetical protein
VVSASVPEGIQLVSRKGKRDRSFATDGYLKLPRLFTTGLLDVTTTNKLLISDFGTTYAFTASGSVDSAWGDQAPELPGQFFVGLAGTTNAANVTTDTAPLPDGGLLLAGFSLPIGDGDVTLDQRSQVDAFVVRVDADGKLSGFGGKGMVLVDTGATCEPPRLVPYPT